MVPPVVVDPTVLRMRFGQEKAALESTSMLLH
jgi:hypothetical protein